MSGEVGCERRCPCRSERGKHRAPGAMVHPGSMQEQKGAVWLRAFPDFGQEDCGPVLDEVPFAQLCRGGHGILKKTEGRYTGGPLFLETSTCSTCRRGDVRAGGGRGQGGIRRKNGALPPRKWTYPLSDREQTESRRPEGRRLSLNREASRMIGEPIRERQHATPFPRAILRANPLTIDEYG